MQNHPAKAAPNYTNAALIMAGVNLSWIFCVIWAIWGVIPVVLIGAGINRWITWLETRRNG